MKIYDHAHELARALKESEEVTQISEAMKLIEADVQSKEMLDNFRLRQNEVQQKMMTGEMPAPEEMEKMEKQFELISQNPHIHKLFDAERRLSVIIQDVNKIITDSLAHLYGGEMQ
ncbi:YlbF family regulator [Paenibacillus turicensis]|uniref:YlbF family regulator n=1 Tax=Paenibacillus turicensis TaxID=160487 RepID=UPI003D2B5CA9